MPPDSKRAAWRALLFAENALVRIFDDELQQECGTSLQVYDVLIRIWLAPCHTLRMSELAESAVLSRSWITRRVDRLEKSGLVERFSSGDDGRGVCVRLTPAGEQAFARLEASHAASIERHFSAYITEEEAVVVARLLERVTAAARHTLAAPAGNTASAGPADRQPAAPA
ncbi:MAG: MarR family transcriptional regulator [Actinomycetota bacterium]|nr:MarR family transcriptional regulator [Actinomycetota bacterium]